MQAVLALFSQSLQQDCRQWSTAFLRAVGMSLLLLVLVLVNSAGTGLATGLGFANWLLWLDYVGISLAAFSWFAAAITEEREQRTLGLLRMTGVNGAAILAGKWLPRLIVVVVLLLVQAPFATLAITMGGVTRYQLFAGLIALMAYAIMMSGIAVLWSVVCTGARRASALVFWSWLCLTTVPWLVGFFLPGRPLAGWMASIGIVIPDSVGWLVGRVHDMSLFRKIDSIFAIQAGETLLDYQVTSNLLVGCGAVVVAWFVFEYVTLYNLETPTKPPLRISRAIRRQKKGRRPQQVGRAWAWAIAWKEFNFIGRGWTFFFVKLFFYPSLGLLIMGVVSANSTPFRETWYLMAGQLFMTIGSIGAMAEIAGTVSRMFHSEIQDNTLGELLVLPVSVTRIGYEKLAGALLSVAPALLILLLGALLKPDAAWDFLEFLFSIGGLMTVVGYLFFLHVSVYLSIHLRVGAVVVAFFLCWIGFTTMLQFGAGSRRSTSLAVVFIVCGLCACAFLQYRIGRDVARKGT